MKGIIKLRENAEQMFLKLIQKKEDNLIKAQEKH
jgi:hypothetical protein